MFLLLLLFCLSAYCVQEGLVVVRMECPMTPFGCFLAMERDREQLVPRSIMDDYDIYFLKQNTLPGIVVDRRRRWIVLSGLYVEFCFCSSITVCFRDGVCSSARVIYRDPYSGFVVIEADKISPQAQEIPLSDSVYKGIADAYYTVIADEHIEVVKGTEEINGVLQDNVGLWHGNKFESGSFLFDPTTQHCVGVSIYPQRPGTGYASCFYIKKKLAMLREKGEDASQITTYQASLISSERLQQNGIYTQKEDKALSFDEDTKFPAHVYLVTEGDGRLLAGDIIKYRHMSQGDKSLWHGYTGFFEKKGSRIKVLRKGKIIDVESQMKKYDTRHIIHDGVLFVRISPYLAAIIGGAQTGSWCVYQLYDDRQLKPTPPRRFFQIDKVNGQKYMEFETLKALLQSNAPVCFEERTAHQMFAVWNFQGGYSIERPPMMIEKRGGMTCGG